jgi:hypothetical protein
MKRIIAAFDGLKYCVSTAAYAIELAKRYNATVVGVFLEDFTYHSFSLVDIAETESSIESHTRQLSSLDQNARDHAVSLFKQNCEQEDVRFTIHRDKNIAIQELLEESLFADLIVVQKKETLTHFEEDVPSRFLAQLLEKSACPVLLVNDYYHPIATNIFLYDGSAASVFALKQFSCLFGDEEKALQVVTIRGEKQELVLPRARLFKEWVKDHYSDVHYSILRG